MANYMLLIHILVCQVLLVKCLYADDSCTADNQSGICTLLSACEPILDEMKKAGRPIPFYLNRRLQSLMCGFENDEPLICCVTPADVEEKPMQWPDINGTPHRNNPKPNPNPTEIIPNPLHNPTDNDDDDEFDEIQNHRNFHLLPSSCGISDSDRLIGGKRTRLFEMPWMVLIAYNTARGRQFKCGGTLISEWYVLTAAHCVVDLADRTSLSDVVLGEHDVRRDPDCERIVEKLYCAPNIRNVTIAEVRAHPGYKRQTLFDDIAIIRLSEPADFNLDSMKAICLPFTKNLREQNLVGVSGDVAGWGATEDGYQSPVLLNVELPILENKQCGDVYNGSIRIYDTQLCAGGGEGKDSCTGDSGGPLTYPGKAGKLGQRFVQRGIVSYGKRFCGLVGYPGVYTRVGSYMKWILDNMRE